MLRLLRKYWRRRPARRLSLAALFLCSIYLSSTVHPLFSSAAPIATPTPGAATVLNAPAPDPVQFDYATQQVLTHQQLNSDFYGLWYQFNALIGALNATGVGAYACGPCITSLTAGTGVSTTLGSQSSGVGVSAQISLAHGDYADLASAQTVGGVKTFSAAPVFQAAPTSANGYAAGSSLYGATSASISGNIALHGTTPNASAAIPITISAGDSTVGGGGQFELGAASGVTVQGVSGTLAGFANTSVAWRIAVDTSGNVGAAGNVTAANFFTGSRREWKRHIRPLGFDAIAMLRNLDLAQYDCSDARCGPIGAHKIGFIANDAPAVLSGAKHDHFDAAALATVDAAAVRQLAAQVAALRAQVRALERAHR